MGRWSANRCVIVAGTMREMVMRGVSLVVSVVIAVVVALGVVAGAMKLADRVGWIEHPRTANVVATANWGEGQEKSCVLQGGMQAPTLVCDSGGQAGPALRMKVKFRGPLHATNWECSRSGEEIDCRAK
jgi:hypothetical protein